MVNCPECLGTGKCYKVTYYDKDSYGELVEDVIQYETPHCYKVRVEGGTIIHGWEECGEKKAKYFEVTCPFCGGDGKAYAYFTNDSRECPSCNGQKRVQIRRKAEIGMETAWSECGTCQGSGVYIDKKTYYLTLFDVPGEKSNGTYFAFDGKSTTIPSEN
jgi:hypothetical protein